MKVLLAVHFPAVRLTIAALGALSAPGRATSAPGSGTAVSTARGPVGAGRTLALVNGRWLVGARFVSVTRYVVDGTLRDRARGAPTSPWRKTTVVLPRLPAWLVIASQGCPPALLKHHPQLSCVCR